MCKELWFREKECEEDNPSESKMWKSKRVKCSECVFILEMTAMSEL
jgi:hypothetical protein